MHKRWREPSGPRFKVHADDGLIYTLAYYEPGDDWHAKAAEPHAEIPSVTDDYTTLPWRNNQR